MRGLGPVGIRALRVLLKGPRDANDREMTDAVAPGDKNWRRAQYRAQSMLGKLRKLGLVDRPIRRDTATERGWYEPWRLTSTGREKLRERRWR